MSLPIYISLKSDNSRYLRHMRDGDHGGGDQDPSLHVYLQFSEKMVERPWTKFEVDISRTEEQLVHIKCCYNNKYWVRISAHSDFIAAVADVPQEDKTRWSCTLFKPVLGVDDSRRVRFQHIHSQSYLSIAAADSSSFEDCLLVSKKDEDPKTSFTFIDWASLVFLPRYLAFKDDQGKYLRFCMIGQENYLQFSGDVTESSPPANEIIPAGEGSFRIKHGDKYWTTILHKKLGRRRLLPSKTNWIILDGKASDRDNQVFRLERVSLDGSTIILRNVGSDNLPCKRLTHKDKKDCLAAVAGHLPITKESHIQVEEYVKERRIENVKYHFQDARIYSDDSTETIIRYATNNTKEEATSSFRLQKQTRTVSCWKSSVSRKLVSKVRISAKIPVFSGGLEASGKEYKSDAYKWGEIIEFLNVVDTAAEITVPGKGKVAMCATEKRVMFEVPFSYTQRDILLNDEVKEEEMEDGVYSGAYTNYFNYHYRKVKQ